jgi:predicted amidohydrolase YtcJ
MLRLTRTGQTCGDEERVTLAEGLRMYTANPAYAEFAEGEKGTIEPGKLADLTILGANLEQVPASEVRDVPVDLTVSSGTIVFERH